MIAYQRTNAADANPKGGLLYANRSLNVPKGQVETQNKVEYWCVIEVQENRAPLIECAQSRID